MDKVTIPQKEYEELKRDAEAWRRAFDEEDNDLVIFNADRDNNGEGVPVEEMIRILRKLQQEDKNR
jgi:hypothetical protein